MVGSGWAQTVSAPVSYTIKTVAGNGQAGYDGDGPVVNARFNSPMGVAVDSSGNIYVADVLNNRVRKIAGQSISTVVGTGTNGSGCDNQISTSVPFTGPGTSAHLGNPSGVAVDSGGRLYVADRDNNCIRQLTGSTVTTFAGSGVPASGGGNGDSGPATKAAVAQPQGVAVDTAGRVFIADTGHGLVREVVNGVIQTVAGGGQLLPQNVPAVNARLNGPVALALDQAGSLYIAESGSGLVLKVAGGQISTIAGGGNSLDENVSATAARLNVPSGLAVDKSGNIYVSERGNCRVRMISNGIISTIAGAMGPGIRCGYSGDTGPATGALLQQPEGLAIDAAGNIFVADGGNNRIRELSSTPGPPGCTYTLSSNGDTVGAALTYDSFTISAPDNCPWTASTAADWIGGLPQTGSGNGTVTFFAAANTGDYPRTAGITAAGQTFALTQTSTVTNPAPVSYTIKTVAGNGQSGYDGDGPVAGARFNDPMGIAVDAAGNIFVADVLNNRVRKIAGQSISTVVGSGSRGIGCDNQITTSVPFTGPGTSAQIASPSGVAVDREGKLYVADRDNNCIRQLTGNTVTTVAGNGVSSGGGGNGDSGPPTKAFVGQPQGVAVDSAGHLYIADTGHGLVREVINGTILTVAGGGQLLPQDVPAVDARLNGPVALALDQAGNLYIADSGSGLVLEVSGGRIFPIAGGGNVLDENVSATTARLNVPSGVAVNEAGDVFVSDRGNCRIRKISNGTITTIAGPLGPGIRCGYSGDNGPATSATMQLPEGLAIDASGNIYLVDSGNQRVRQLVPNPSTNNCGYVLSATSDSLGGGAASDSFKIDTQEGCPWTASTSADWIHGLPQSGKGPGTVTFSVSVNDSSQPRQDKITVAEQPSDSTDTFTVKQSGKACAPGVFGGSQPASCGCGRPAITPPAPGGFSMTSNYSQSPNTWSANWAVSGLDGLQLTNVRGFDRFVAGDIRVPYFTLQTTDFDSAGHCELRPDGSGAQGNCTSSLVAFSASNQTLHATYEIDNIPAGTNSCLLITQTYEFVNFTSGCEPSGTVLCARLKPTVSYQYLPDDPGKSIQKITIAQRFQFDLDGDGLQPNTAALLMDAGAALNGFDPVPREMVQDAIRNGARGDFDNYHQHANGIISVPTPLNPAGVLGISGAPAGCPECVHIHWRWDLGDLVPKGLGFIRNIVSLFPDHPKPTWESTGTSVIIPPGSTQSAKVGVLAARDDEAHPSQDFDRILTTRPAAGLANPCGFQNLERCATERLAFWYAGTREAGPGDSGGQNADQFFTHYLWVSPQAYPTDFGVVHGVIVGPGGSAPRSGSPRSAAADVYSQTLTVTNNTGSPVLGPIFVVLDNLPQNVALANADGYAINRSPYVRAVGELGVLAANASVRVTLQFNNPSNVPISYSERVVTGGAP